MGSSRQLGGGVRRARHSGIVVAQVDAIVHPGEHVSQVVVGWAACWVTVPPG